MESTFDKWLAGAGALVALLVVAAGLTFQNTRRLNEDASWVAHTHDVIDTLDEIIVSMREAEAVQRSSIITDDESRSAEVTAGIDAAKRSVETLRRLTDDNPDQQARISDVQKGIADLAGLWSYTARVRNEQGFEAARNIISSDKADRAMTKLHGALRQMGDSERTLLDERAAKTERTYCSAILTGLLTGVAAVTGIVAFMVLLRRHLAVRKRAEHALQEADCRKDEFLATLAHELRNPLAPLRNALQVMRLAGGNVELLEQARGIMDRQLSQLVRLVDDLLDVSRISRGKIELRKERVELAAVVQSAVETSRPLIEQTGQQLTVTVPQQPVYVDADVTRLAQACMNLLNNAAKYSEPGGQIWLTVERHGSEVALSVKDTGTGIAASELPRIFDLFTQVHRSLDKAQGGLGIGLSLVKRLVEMHGGRIEAKSEGPGRGSEFIMTLPVLTDAPDPPSTHESENLASFKSSLRILIVDDNLDGAQSLAAMLKMMGNDTCTAYEGLEGLDAAERFRPHVILLDIGLPKLDGFEVCRRIRQQPWGKNMVVVAVTGWGQDHDRRRSQEAGFDQHLVKPANLPALTKLLAEVNSAND